MTDLEMNKLRDIWHERALSLEASFLRLITEVQKHNPGFNRDDRQVVSAKLDILMGSIDRAICAHEASTVDRRVDGVRTKVDELMLAMAELERGHRDSIRRSEDLEHDRKVLDNDQERRDMAAERDRLGMGADD